MGNYSKSAILIIKTNYDKLTSVEKSIGDFFLQNREHMDFSAKAVAEKLYVSEASLSRFAKKCGFRGYREFMYLYEECFVEKKDSAAGSVKLVLGTYQELLNKTYNLVDEQQMKWFSRQLSKAGRVFVCGMGSSGLAAREMELRFMRIGVDIDSIDNSDMMKMQAVFQNETCMVIGISISGEKEEVLFLLKEAHKRKAKTVLLTANTDKSFSQFCDEVILMPSLLHLHHGNIISPQFPILVFLDICYAYYIAHDKNKKEALHDYTLKALTGEKENDFI